jgi:hypothetical protein
VLFLSVYPSPLSLYARGALTEFVDYVEAIPNVDRVRVRAL